MSQWPRLKLSNSLSLGQGFRVFIWGWGDKYGHIVNMYVFFRAHKSLGYPSDHCPPFMNRCLRTSNNKNWGNSQRSLRLGTVWGVHIRAIILRWQSMSEGLLFVLGRYDTSISWRYFFLHDKNLIKIQRNFN